MNIDLIVNNLKNLMTMKKGVSIFAVVLLAMSMFSCQPENSVEETQALYDIQDVDANDENQTQQSGGSGGN